MYKEIAPFELVVWYFHFIKRAISFVYFFTKKVAFPLSFSDFGLPLKEKQTREGEVGVEEFTSAFECRVLTLKYIKKNTSFNSGWSPYLSR
jgi:hypothetical protein